MPGVSHMQHNKLPRYDEHQSFYKTACKVPQHCVFISARTANTSPTAFRCHMCDSRQPSSHEQDLYDLCAEENCIELFAAEGYCLHKGEPLQFGHNDVLCPSKKPWDVVIAKPHGLLIEMQGQGHSSKLMTKHNNKDSSIDEKQDRDMAYAQEAVRQGWSVLWLWVDDYHHELHGRRTVWAAQIRQAMAHVVSGQKPKLFV